MEDPWTDKVTLLLQVYETRQNQSDPLIDDGLRKNVEILTSVVFK